MAQLLTTGQIAEKMNVPLWRIHYLLASRGIKEYQRIGNLRVFRPAIIDTLREELAGIDQRKRNAS